MTLRNLCLLLIIMTLIGCNQTDSNTESGTDEQAKTQTQTSGDDNNADEPVKSTGKVLARVNGNPIYEEDLGGRNLQFLVTEEIIYQVGLKQGIDQETKDRIADYKKRLIISKTKADIMNNAEATKKVSDEEIQQYYDNNKDKYTYVKIHEISFSDSELGDEIKSKADNGEELEDIAKSYPDEQITVTDIGFDKRMAQNFDNLEVGSISGVVEKPNGTFSVLKIVEVREIPLKVSKRSIRKTLEAKQTAHMFDNYAREAAKENNIEVEIIK